MITTCKRYIDEFHMIKKGDLVIAGVSGGADSLCLFHVLVNLRSEMDFTLKVVHVEHGIRGEESKQDAAFVKELCQTYGVICKICEVDVPAYAKTHHLGVEEAARVLRYDAFLREADQAVEQGILEAQIKIALAHHADDNAETILFQMARGSGLAGLCGIKEVRKTEKGFSYVRPLLWAKREQIETYLQKIGQEFCVDSTNADTDYSRNRIRRNILPELEKVNKEAVSHMNQTAKRLGKIQDFLFCQAKEAYQTCVTETAKTCEIQLSELAKLHPALGEEVVKLAVYEAAGQKKDIGAVHIEAVFSLRELQSGKKISLPYDLVARREFDRIIIEMGGTGNQDDPYRKDWNRQKKACSITPDFLEELKTSGREVSFFVDEEKFSLKIEKFLGKIEEIPKKRYTKFLDYDMIKDGFTIRTRRPGDEICIDEAGHHKKVKDYFVQEKVSQELRDEIWLMAQESQILWIVGMRMAENCKITEHTQYGLRIRYNGGTKDGLQ